jgi:hypothetical protein
MAEIRPEPESAPPFGWAFIVSLQRIGEMKDDRTFLAPYYVGVSDKEGAIAALKAHLGWTDAYQLDGDSPMAAGAAQAIGLAPMAVIQLWPSI